MIGLNRHAELVSASIPETSLWVEKWTLKGDGSSFAVEAQKLVGISLEGSVG